MPQGHDRLCAKALTRFYHPLVLWVARGVTCDEVWIELERRFGASNAIKELRKKCSETERG